MTGRSHGRFLSSLCMTLVLGACGGGAGVDTASDGAAASAAQHASGTTQPGEGTSGPGTTQAAPTGRGGAGDGARGNPGGPGADPAGGGERTDVEAQGNPGAPGDVAVFEEAGVPYRVLEDDAAGRCADGVCTLLAPVVGGGDPDDLGGVDECVVQKQSDIRYDPPARDGFFRRGATVQATVDCTTDDTGTDGTATDDTQPADESATSSSATSSSATSSSGTSQDQVPTDEPQG